MAISVYAQRHKSGFFTKERSKNGLWKTVCPNDEASSHPCQWGGITCKGDRVVHIHFSRKEYTNMGRAEILPGEWKVDMQWLPSTVREIHFYMIQLVRGWTAYSLPRSLRYISLFDRKSSSKRSVDFRKLPAHLEVLIVERGWLQGAIFLDMLPQTLRTCILYHRSITKVFVHSDCLPKSLEKFVLCNHKHEIQIRELGERSTDARVMVTDKYAKHLPKQYWDYFYNGTENNGIFLMPF